MLAATERRRRARRGRPQAAASRLAFIAQDDLPAGAAYEAHIASTGCVPTRHNLHDFFNASMWFAFPRIKAALNARQAAQIDALGIGPTRGGVRDTLTLFDENAVLFACADPALSGALRGFDWHTLFVARRDGVGRALRSALFGHALLEKLVAPYKACTGHAWIVDVPPLISHWTLRNADALLDERSAHALLRPKRRRAAFRAAAGAGRSGLVADERIARFLRRHERISPGPPRPPRVSAGVKIVAQSRPGSRGLCGFGRRGRGKSGLHRAG